MTERDPRGNHLECSRCPEEFAFVDSLILHWQIFHGNPYGRLYLGMGRNRPPRPRESLADLGARKRERAARKRAEREHKREMWEPTMTPAEEPGTMRWQPQHGPCKRCGAEPPVEGWGWPGYPVGGGSVAICLACWLDITGRPYRQPPL